MLKIVYVQYYLPDQQTFAKNEKSGFSFSNEDCK